jgi:hypothetical protein
VLLLQIGSVSFDRQGVADHASQLANNIQGNLKRSLEGLGVVRAAGRDTQHSASDMVSPQNTADGMLAAVSATAQLLLVSVSACAAHLKGNSRAGQNPIALDVAGRPHLHQVHLVSIAITPW